MVAEGGGAARQQDRSGEQHGGTPLTRGLFEGRPHCRRALRTRGPVARRCLREARRRRRATGVPGALLVLPRRVRAGEPDPRGRGADHLELDRHRGPQRRRARRRVHGRGRRGSRRPARGRELVRHRARPSRPRRRPLVRNHGARAARRVHRRLGAAPIARRRSPGPPGSPPSGDAWWSGVAHMAEGTALAELGELEAARDVFDRRRRRAPEPGRAGVHPDAPRRGERASRRPPGRPGGARIRSSGLRGCRRPLLGDAFDAGHGSRRS